MGYAIGRRVLVTLVAALPSTSCGADTNALSAVEEQWFDQAGKPVSDDIVEAYRVGQHCDWHDDVVLLQTGAPLGSDWTPTSVHQYVGDPQGVFEGHPDVPRGFEADVKLPPDATYTGYHTNSAELWLNKSDPDAAYIVRDGTTQLWPRATQRVGCA